MQDTSMAHVLQKCTKALFVFVGVFFYRWPASLSVLTQVKALFATGIIIMKCVVLCRRSFARFCIHLKNARHEYDHAKGVRPLPLLHLPHLLRHNLSRLILTPVPQARKNMPTLSASSTKKVAWARRLAPLIWRRP